MVTWLHGYMVTWLHGYMVTWLHGYMVTQYCHYQVITEEKLLFGKCSDVDILKRKLEFLV